MPGSISLRGPGCCDGRKTVVGLREGATENAAVMGELLSDLLARGLDFSVPKLYILDRIVT